MTLSGLLACLTDGDGSTTAPTGLAQVGDAASAGIGSLVEAPGPMHPIVVAEIVRRRSSAGPVFVVTATGREAEDVAATLPDLVPGVRAEVFTPRTTRPEKRPHSSGARTCTGSFMWWVAATGWIAGTRIGTPVSAETSRAMP